MINLLLGAPGGGKSYEAVVFHILPAIQNGRKVITNLPLDLDVWHNLYPESKELIEIRTTTVKPRPVIDHEKTENLFKRFGWVTREQRYNPMAFANIEDYESNWHHPESGTGALFVIDECHFVLPRLGTPMQIEEWFSIHRKQYVDVLLITQSYGKINQAVRDLVQAVYKVRKNTALGSASSYTRKVQDGLRGEVVNSSIRTYKPEFFKYYKSHSKTGGSELAASDIQPIWKHWSFMGAALMFIILAVMFASGAIHNPLKPTIKPIITKPVVKTIPSDVLASIKSQTTNNSSESSFKASQTAVASTESSEPKESKKDADEPLAERGIHISGHMHNAHHEVWVFTVSQNGQKVFTLSLNDLQDAGYSFTPFGECIAMLKFHELKRFISCDAPSSSVTVGSSRI